MKKIDFISLVLTIIGTLVFGLGMCMALIEEWAMLEQGVIVGTIGAVILLFMVFIRRKMEGKPMIKLNAKVIGYAIYTIFSLVIFGVGLTIVLAFERYMIWGIIMGIVGIALLLFLIPMLGVVKD